MPERRAGAQHPGKTVLMLELENMIFLQCEHSLEPMIFFKLWEGTITADQVNWPQMEAWSTNFCTKNFWCFRGLGDYKYREKHMATAD